MIPEFELILSERQDRTSVSYCMLYSFAVDMKDEPVFRTIESDSSGKRNQLTGQFIRRYSNTLDFTHWNPFNNEG